MFLVAFYGLFCIGELATKSTSIVQYNSLTFLSHNGLSHMTKISISEFKHNRTKKPFNILLAREDFTTLPGYRSFAVY